jgi:ABC-type Fe3+/spermidine/putrescine transport system ATPase subunit
VQLARVLALEAEVLMLDEPLAGLDPLIRSELLADLATTLPERGAATMVVLHERAEAWALADRLLILIDGRLVAAGPPAEVLERPPTPEVAAFLGFDGELREPDGSILRLRPAHVIVDPDGVRRGVVTRRIPEEDVVRLQLRLTEGSVHALAAYPGPALGETVALRIEGGVRFGGRREVGRALLA